MERIGSARSPHSWTAALMLAVRWGFALAVSLAMVGAFRVLVAESERLPWMGDLSLLGLELAQVAVVAFALVGFSRLWSDVVLVVGTAALLALFLAGQLLAEQSPVQLETNWWPTSAVVAVQCWVLAFGGRWRWWLGASACAAYAGLRLLGAVLAEESLRVGVAELVSGLQLALMLVLGIRAVRRIALHSDRVEQQRMEALWAEQKQRIAESRSREIVRFLHDDVIHTLRALAAPRGLSTARVTELARQTAIRLRHGDREPRADDAVGLRERLIALGPETGVRVTLSGRTLWVPSYVADAVVAATAEALRNVARHSGADEARIAVESRNGGITVRITDDGTDFATDHTANALYECFIGRMADIGGVAILHSGAEGTTVELTWQPAGVEARVSTTLQELTRALTPAVIPSLVGTSLMGLLIAPEVARPRLLLVAVVMVTVTGFASLSRDGRHLPPWRVLLILVVAVLALLVNMLAVSPETRNGFHLLLAGGVTPLLMIVVIHWPLRLMIPATVVVWAVLAGLGAWRFGWDALTRPLFGALTAPVVVVALIGVKLLLMWMGRRILIAHDDTVRSRLRTEHTALRQDSRDDRLQRIRARVLPLLEAAAEGRLDLANPAVARRARALEAGVREEIRLDRRPEAFAETTDAVRNRGWVLEVRVTQAQLETLERQLLTLLGALDHPPDGSGRAVLSAVTGVALVVQHPARTSIERWRCRSDVELEEADTWARLTPKTSTTRQRRPVLSRR